VRQAKLAISCKVKVLVLNSREWVQRPNQPPVSSVAPLAEYSMWLWLQQCEQNRWSVHRELYRSQGTCTSLNLFQHR